MPRYVRIQLDGGSHYVQTLEALQDAMDGEFDGAEPGTRWTLTLVEMPEEEFDALPEFEGH